MEYIPLYVPPFCQDGPLRESPFKNQALKKYAHAWMSSAQASANATCVHPDPTCPCTCLPNYPATYLLAYHPTHQSIYQLVYLPAHLPSCLPTYLPTYQLEYLRTSYLNTDLTNRTPACLLANYLPTYLLPTYLPRHYLPTTSCTLSFQARNLLLTSG